MDLFYPHLDKETARKKAINQWALEQQIQLELKEKQPEENEKNQLKNKDALQKLNLFSLENAYIQSHIDSAISKQEILKYYNHHRDDYKAKSYIVKALYIKIPDSLDKKIHIAKYYLLNNKKDQQVLEKFAKEYALSFYFEPKRWIYLDDLMREIPTTASQKEQLVKTQKHAIFHSDGETHYINILDYSTKSVSSPMEVERMNIRSQILQERAYKLRNKVKEIIIKHVKEKYPITYF